MLATIAHANILLAKKRYVRIASKRGAIRATDLLPAHCVRYRSVASKVSSKEQGVGGSWRLLARILFAAPAAAGTSAKKSPAANAVIGNRPDIGKEIGRYRSCLKKGKRRAVLAYHAPVGAKQQRITALASCRNVFRGVLSR